LARLVFFVKVLVGRDVLVVGELESKVADVECGVFCVFGVFGCVERGEEEKRQEEKWQEGRR